MGAMLWAADGGDVRAATRGCNAAAIRGPLRGPGVGEAVGVGAGFDDAAVVGEAVDDGCAEVGVGEGVGPVGYGLVGRGRDAVLPLEPAPVARPPDLQR